MKKKRIGRILTVATFMILYAGLGFMGMRTRAIGKERDALLAERTALEGKAATLKKAQAEQKAQADAALRARQAAEAKAVKAVQTLAGAEAQVADLTAKVETLETQVAKGHDADQERQEQVKEVISQWKAKVEELQAAAAGAQAKIKEGEARIAALEASLTATKASLESESRQHRSCRENNGKLAAIAQELAKSYRGKGVLEAMRSSEPLTQLKKVELERFVQEYLDRIDSETLPMTGSIRQ